MLKNIQHQSLLYLIFVIFLYGALLLPSVPRQGISWDEQTDIDIARFYLSQPGGWLLGSDSDPSQARLPMYVVAMIYKLIGVDNLLTARYTSVIVGGLTILGVYIFCKQEYDSKRGVLAAGILATSPFFLSFAKTAFTETDIYAACLFIWFLVCFSNFHAKRTIMSAWIAAAVLGLAISSKFTALFLYPAILVHIFSWLGQNTKQANIRLRAIVGIAVPLIILFSIAFLSWTGADLPFGAQNNTVVAVTYYLLAMICWAVILLWVANHHDQTASPYILGILVLVLATTTFIMFPPVHLTNPDIIHSLFYRVDHEMGLNLKFMVEAIGLHLGCVIFKSSPMVGFGLLAGIIWAVLQWKKQKQVRMPLLVVIFYFMGLASLPIAQTFYMVPLLPFLAILGADLWFSLQFSHQKLAVLVGVVAIFLLAVDLACCYPDYNLNGYQWLGPRNFLGRPTIGYRSIVQTTSDGVQQTIQWVCQNAKHDDRVVIFAYPWHIVEASCPDPTFRISRGQQDSLLSRPDFVLIHINHRIRASWSAWIPRWDSSQPVDSIFWEPCDNDWLDENYTKVYSVPRAFGIEMASVYQRK